MRKANIGAALFTDRPISRNILLIATTNFPEALDAAVLSRAIGCPPRRAHGLSPHRPRRPDRAPHRCPVGYR